MPRAVIGMATLSEPERFDTESIDFTSLIDENGFLISNVTLKMIVELKGGNFSYPTEIRIINSESIKDRGFQIKLDHLEDSWLEGNF
jgi:hypothetical protein